MRGLSRRCEGEFEAAFFSANFPVNGRAMTITKAIILSAGQGSRLLPLTRDVPKCMIPFNGRTLISWQIAALVANGVTDIVVVRHLRGELRFRCYGAKQLAATMAADFKVGPEPSTSTKPMGQ